MQYYTHHHIYEKGIACGQKILKIDGLREEVHRHLMRLYVAHGERTLAIRQYEVCGRLLQEELGVLPMLETQAVYQEVMGDNSRLSWERNEADLVQVLQKLDVAIERLDSAREYLRQTVREVRQLTNKHHF